jgi:Adenylate and Guanylate cyclase catalytic domain
MGYATGQFIRIGLNCANVLVGNIGSSTRLSYTALGDGVNVAARLEGINKLFGTTICISDSIFDQVQDEILARPPKRVQVKGRKTEFMIYELLGLRASDDPDLKLRDRDAQLSAMESLATDGGWRFRRGRTRLSRDPCDDFPADSVAKFMVRECRERRTSRVVGL